MNDPSSAVFKILQMLFYRLRDIEVVITDDSCMFLRTQNVFSVGTKNTSNEPLTYWWSPQTNCKFIHFNFNSFQFIQLFSWLVHSSSCWLIILTNTLPRPTSHWNSIWLVDWQAGLCVHNTRNRQPDVKIPTGTQVTHRKLSQIKPTLLKFNAGLIFIVP